MPVEAVAAEAQVELGDLRHTSLGTGVVLRAQVNGERPEHELSLIHISEPTRQ